MRPRRPDEHFADEARAALAAGHEVAVLGDGAPVPASDDVVYRGWMMSGAEYAALAARGVALRTGPADYRRAHELPGWYAAVASRTPRSVWTCGDDRAGFLAACASLGSGAAVLRDYTKSMKHYWDEAAFVPSVADTTAAWRVASRFRELRDDDFTGGFVLRRFEEFTGAEVRTWWVDGVCRLVTAHPDTPSEPPPTDLDVAGFAPLISGLRLPFVTADLVRRADGEWRLVEIGDGQVSDRPRSTPAAELIAALAR
ncbi:hypothetical protein Asi03nite_58390 [Actinoplanes siamensis]|uniref:ATP-grasp domain-containing protein n=1 Tax=Actinoplanes siamensis TaxID=1223317 RepID=A0A919TMG6_9ACTN|nr:hypothetical protein Asi03nite_58390 [Actinoplanes siamensis]